MISLSTHIKKGEVKFRYLLGSSSHQGYAGTSELSSLASECHSSRLIPSNATLSNFYTLCIFLFKMFSSCDFLVAQWLRFCTPSERTQVQGLIRELDPTCCSRQRKRTHICNEDQRCCMLQLRPGANKKINIKKKCFLF